MGYLAALFESPVREVALERVGTVLELRLYVLQIEQTRTVGVLVEHPNRKQLIAGPHGSLVSRPPTTWALDKEEALTIAPPWIEIAVLTTLGP